MNKKIAIIGSNSYIASHFYKRADKYDFRLFVYRSSGNEKEIVKDFFTINNDDLKGVDILINFAAIVHKPKHRDDSEYRRVNTLLPIKLAKMALDAGVKHFVQMSSIAVYGNGPIYDANTAYNPQEIYGRTKMEADLALLELQTSKFKVSLVRPPMVYGGGLSPGNMQRIVRLALKGFPMPVKGLNNKRDIIHVDNLVDALLLIVDNTLDGVLIPTDKQSISTENIIDLVDIYSHKRVRKVLLPTMAKKIMAKVIPHFYQKVFGDFNVICNMPDVYHPNFKLEDGIADIVSAIEES